eukprot:g48.t1
MRALSSFLGILALDAYRLPPHSWDTLPVAWHSALDRSLSAEDARALARYPLVTLEKTQGSAAYSWPHGLPLACQNGTNVSSCGCCEEDHIVAAGRAIKAVNASVMVIAYMNSIISYPWYRAARDLLRNSSWWLRDVNGSLVNNIKHNPDETWFTWNFADPAVGELWSRACLAMTATGAVDGCFMDGCANANPAGNRLIVPGPLAQATREAYARNKPAWMARLQARVPGVLVCGSGGGWVDGVAATQVQNWGVHSQDYAGLWIPMLQRAVAAGVLFEAHAACGSSDPLDPAEQSKLAAFLVAAGPSSYFLCGGWGSAQVDWFPVYDMPLGAPEGNATLGADGNGSTAYGIVSAPRRVAAAGISHGGFLAAHLALADARVHAVGQLSAATNLSLLSEFAGDSSALAGELSLATPQHAAALAARDGGA